MWRPRSVAIGSWGPRGMAQALGLMTLRTPKEERTGVGSPRRVEARTGIGRASNNKFGEGNSVTVAKPDPLLVAIQEVLFREWDPIGVNDNELCRDEYDSYAPAICRWLREGVDEHRLAAHLSELQRVSMEMSVIDEELHRRVARRLLELAS